MFSACDEKQVCDLSSNAITCLRLSELLTDLEPVVSAAPNGEDVWRAIEEVILYADKIREWLDEGITGISGNTFLT